MFIVIDIFWKVQFLKHFISKIMSIFWSLNLEHTLIYQIFQNVEIAEKFLNGI